MPQTTRTLTASGSVPLAGSDPTGGKEMNHETLKKRIESLIACDKVSQKHFHQIEGLEHLANHYAGRAVAEQDILDLLTQTES